MRGSKRIWIATTAMALFGSNLIGPAAPAAAGPAPAEAEPSRIASTWAEPVAGTSAEIEFADAGTPARAASLSPYLSEIMTEAKQVRTVDIDAGALDPALAAESVDIELFDGVNIALETTVALSEGAGASDRSSRTYSAGGRDGAAIITIIGGDLHGSLWKGATKFGIEPLGGGRHLVFEEGRTFPEEGEPVGDGGSATDLPAPAAPARPDAPGVLAVPVIDVMFAFDEDAIALFGSVAAVEAEIVEMVNLSNMTYVNSLNDQELALTNILNLNYTPNQTDGTTNDNTYLSAIRSKTDGIVDNLHTVRDANDADLVAVITDMSSGSGLAYYPSSSNPAELNAYSLTDGAFAVSNLTITHELGHNMCADHDPVHAQATNPCEPDSFGHFSVADSLRTVMSYGTSMNGCTGCTRIPYFSNPNVTFSGWTTGILGSRDNSRVLEVTDDMVAAYRPVPPPCEVDYTIADTWPGNVQVELEVHNTTTSTFIGGWTSKWTFTGDESVYNSWGVVVSQIGPEATAVGDGFGASIPPGSSVTVGFQATVTGTPTVPSPISCEI